MIMCKKRKFVFGLLVVMVCIAGYLNFRYDNKEFKDLDEYISTVTEVEDSKDESLGEAQMVMADKGKKQTEDVFAKCRLERDECRSENIDLLKSTIENTSVSEDAKLRAEGQLLNISDNIEKEVNIENIVRLKGFKDVMAFISGDSVTVTVRSEKLTEPQIAQINDAVNEYIDTNNVKIVEVN